MKKKIEYFSISYHNTVRTLAVYPTEWLYFKWNGEWNNIQNYWILFNKIYL